MAWDDDIGEGEGKVRKTLNFVSGQGTVFLYRVVVGIMTTVCAGLSGLIFNGFIDQGKQLSAIVAMEPRTEQRLLSIEGTIGNHTDQINSATSQEKMDAALMQGQIQQILKKLDDFSSGLDTVQQKLQSQDTKLTNLGIAVARVRGAQAK